MIAACAKCHQLYDRRESESTCLRCSCLAELIDCADSFVLWRLKVELVSNSEAGAQLTALIDRAEALAAKARAL